MNPFENLRLSQFLAEPPKKNPHDEACWRGACGRAYYAAFATARDLLLAANHLMHFNGNDHKEVVRLLKKSNDEDVAAAGALLYQLRDERNQADYDVGARPPARPFDKLRSQKAILRANQIIEDIVRVAKSDPTLKI